jgi:hypothetical protein
LEDGRLQSDLLGRPAGRFGRSRDISDPVGYAILDMMRPQPEGLRQFIQKVRAGQAARRGPLAAFQQDADLVRNLTTSWLLHKLCKRGYWQFWRRRPLLRWTTT